MLFARGWAPDDLQDRGPRRSRRDHRHSGHPGGSARTFSDRRSATGNIYVGTKRGQIVGLKPDLTDLFPAVRLDSPISSTAALSPDGATVYVMTSRGKLWGVDSKTGAIRPGFPQSVAPGRFVRGQAPVVDAAGNIYLGDSGERKGSVPDSASVWAFRSDGIAPLEDGGRIGQGLTIVDGGLLVISSFQIPSFHYDLNGDRVFVEGQSKTFRFCPPPVGPPEAQRICGFTVDTTVAPAGG